MDRRRFVQLAIAGLVCSRTTDAPAATHLNFLEVAMKRPYVRRQSNVLQDVENRVEPARRATYRSSDTGNAVHEMTHAVNNDLRNQHNVAGALHNGFYLLNGRGVVLPEPNTTLSAVARMIPESVRGSRYQLYFIDQQRYWNDHPLYVFDELACYVNGAAYEAVDGDPGSSRIAAMHEFVRYAMHTMLAISKLDPNYSNIPALRELYQIQSYRSRNITSIAGSKNLR